MSELISETDQKFITFIRANLNSPDWELAQKIRSFGLIYEWESEYLIDILSKINAMLVVKHGKIFNVKGKAPSWKWIIKKLDEILTKKETK